MHAVTYVVTFVSWPTYPAQNNVFEHDGNPPLSSFTCDVSKVETIGGGGKAVCSIEDVVSEHVKPYTACAGRGECDFQFGTCECYEHFEGAACHKSLAAVSPTAS